MTDSKTYFAGSDDRVTFSKPNDGTFHPWTCPVCGSLIYHDEELEGHANEHKHDHSIRHKVPGLKEKRLTF